MISFVALSAAVSVAAQASGCMTVLRPISADQSLVAADLADTASCDDGVDPKALRYDRALGAVRARHDLTIGDLVPHIASFALADIRPGQSLVVRIRVGPVQIERAVVALQTGRAGGNLFVKAADGNVFPIAVEDILQ